MKNIIKNISEKHIQCPPYLIIFYFMAIVSFIINFFIEFGNIKDILSDLIFILILVITMFFIAQSNKVKSEGIPYVILIFNRLNIIIMAIISLFIVTFNSSITILNINFFNNLSIINKDNIWELLKMSNNNIIPFILFPMLYNSIFYLLYIIILDNVTNFKIKNNNELSKIVSGFLIIGILLCNLICTYFLNNFFITVTSCKQISIFKWLREFYDLSLSTFKNLIQLEDPDFQKYLEFMKNSKFYKDFLKFPENINVYQVFEQTIIDTIKYLLIIIFIVYIIGNSGKFIINTFFKLISKINNFHYYIYKIIVLFPKKDMKISKICRKKFCPFCGKYSYSFTTYNIPNLTKNEIDKLEIKSNYPSVFERIRLKYENPKSCYFENEKFFYYDENEKINKNLQCGELTRIIYTQENTLNQTIKLYQLSHYDDISYYSVEKNNQITNTEYLKYVFSTCSKCGMETFNFKPKSIYFVGCTGSAKTTLISKISELPSVKKLKNSLSYDCKYWNNIKKSAQNNTLEATNVIKSPAKIIKYGIQKFALFDIMGEIVNNYNNPSSSKPLIISSYANIVFTISAEINNASIDYSKLMSSLVLIETIFNDLKNSTLKNTNFFLVLTKSDNLASINNFTDAIQKKINTLLNLIGQKDLYYIAPDPKEQIEYQGSISLKDFSDIIFK